ncbi:MAG: ribonuclease H-like domain-containing protein [Halobacteriota archaeon]
MRVENSFIPVRGVGQRTEQRLWREGITHWNAFEPEVLGGRTGRRVEAFIDTASERLAAGDAAFFAEAFPTKCRWRLYENFRESTVFLDNETTGLSQRHHDVTVVSLHDATGTRTLVRGRDLTRERLCDALDGADLLVTYNGRRFDVPFLERAFDLPIDLPHLDLMYPCRRLDLTGGLKVVERTLGVDRDEPDISGRDAVRLWRRYEAGDSAALDTLIRYNRDDTVNLRAVTEAVCERLHRRVFVEPIPTNQARLGGDGLGD